VLGAAVAEARLIFGNLVEALFLRALDGQVTPALQAALQAAGVALDKLLPAYPAEEWERALQIAQVTLYPRLQPDESMEILGQLVIQGYEQTRLGGAMLESVRLLGPKRALERLPRLLGSFRNTSETRIASMGARECELWVGDAREPAFMKGMLLGLLIAAGAQDCVVELLAPGEPGWAGFHIHWTGGPTTREVPVVKPPERS
jgi:uncharacterized protein (TIGR02265 family)